MHSCTVPVGATELSRTQLNTRLLKLALGACPSWDQHSTGGRTLPSLQHPGPTAPHGMLHDAMCMLGTP